MSDFNSSLRQFSWREMTPTIRERCTVDLKVDIGKFNFSNLIVFNYFTILLDVKVENTFFLGVEKCKFFMTFLYVRLCYCYGSPCEGVWSNNSRVVSIIILRATHMWILPLIFWMFLGDVFYRDSTDCHF